MSLLTDKGIALLGSATVDMQNASGAHTIFTTATGKVTRIVAVVIANPSATLAGGTDFDFTQWRQTVDLSGLTGGATNYRVLLDVGANGTSFVELAAGTAFQITPSTGSTGAATADVYVFGFTATT
jgi:hypothetical protein